MTTVSVTIDNKTYRMACNSGQEEHLTGLAAKLNQYINHLKSDFGEIGDHRLSIMAGIMIMDEMSEIQTRMNTLKSELDLLHKENEITKKQRQKQQAQATSALNQAAEHIEKIATKLANLQKK